MNFSNLDFFIEEAWLGIRRSGMMSVVALLTITASLCVLGLFLIGMLNTNNVLKSVTTRLELMVYLRLNVTEDQGAELQQDLTRLPQIKNIVFISKEEGWQSFQTEFANVLPFAGLDYNPLPHALRISVYKLEVIPQLAELIGSYPEVDRVVYGGDLVKRIRTFSDTMRLFGFSMTAFLGLATLFIVINTIRLTVIARKDEIEIMQLVGATSSFIRWPFVFEGILMGFVAAIIAITTLFYSYHFLVSEIQSSFIFLPVMAKLGYFHWIWFVMALCGIGVGLIGGYISVTQALRSNLH